MSKYKDLANSIVENVGGYDNIEELTHCMTRLRFKLKDKEMVNETELRNNEGIVGLIDKGGVYQVVIGNHVNQVYSEITNHSNIGDISLKEVSKEEGGIINKFTSTITKIITPILGVLSAAGLLKALIAILLTFKLINDTSGAYSILNAAGDALFMFFPIIIGYTSAKTFGLNPIIGMVIGAALVYPGLQEALTSGDTLYILFEGSILEMPITSTFFGIPVMFPAAGYTGTVIPIIFANWFASKVEKFSNKKIPEIVSFTITPFIVIFTTVIATILIIGPVANILNALIESMTLGLYGFNPIIATIVIAFIYQPLVIFGLHWPLIFIAIANYGTLGYDYIFSMVYTANFAQAAVVLAVLLRTKSEKQKKVCIPAIISALVVIIEPAIYGVTLPQKRRFLISMLSSIVGGVIITMFAPRMYAPISGIFGFAGFITPDGNTTGVVVSIIATIVTMVIAFVAAWVTFKEIDFDDLEKLPNE